jgi:hypothetical protein
LYTATSTTPDARVGSRRELLEIDVIDGHDVVIVRRERHERGVDDIRQTGTAENHTTINVGVSLVLTSALPRTRASRGCEIGGQTVLARALCSIGDRGRVEPNLPDLRHMRR